jgi:gluconokinase
MACSHIVVMGVSGSGKSLVGAVLADELDFDFIEGDDHHPPANVEKMAAGIPLTDADREPWLAALAAAVAERHDHGRSTVLACSALRRRYRDVLRGPLPPEESFVIELDGDRATLLLRLEHRRGHYMPPSLLDSQLATLEPLERDEAGAIIDVTREKEAVVARAITAVRDWHATLRPGR